MFNRTPRLEIYQDRICDNARAIARLCHEHGAQLACVTKVSAAHPSVAEAMIQAGSDMLADSRVANLWALRGLGFRVPLMLLRLPAPSEAYEVVQAADYSLNSGLPTLRALSEAARAQRVVHKVILMIDVGDLREGVWPDRAVEVVKTARDLPNLEVAGLGCNLACYGGVIPSVENMLKLVQVRDLCRRETGLPLNLLSGGNSSGLPLLASGKMPKEINHFRVGEAILLGRNVIDRSPFPGTRQDTVIGVGQVIELERKPSIPIGDRGQDAFGGTTSFVDRGVRWRAICNLGRQDVVVDGIAPVDPRVIVLGGSSDHLLVDVEDVTPHLEVGGEIAFYPGYGALLALSTSPYVHKFVIRGK
ncbi:MAG: alanine/ornithine racemase family PLP-dependent enzyme [Candidatus Riflebacteria bacterium]|nr:alanine/ornithine racemase family PLP-dependent enzyme [Candidatus Riflebacteria bacterium]